MWCRLFAPYFASYKHRRRRQWRGVDDERPSEEERRAAEWRRERVDVATAWLDRPQCHAASAASGSPELPARPPSDYIPPADRARSRPTSDGHISVAIGISRFEHILRLDLNYKDLLQKIAIRFEICSEIFGDSIRKKSIRNNLNRDNNQLLAYLRKTKCTNHRNTSASGAIECQNCTELTDWLTL